MKSYIFSFLLLLFSTPLTLLTAGEGMWLPQLLKALNEGEMQTMGMKLTAEQIYSVNQGSLKDAIVHFGGFCTAEVISDQGLLLTNHHCGYGQIQSHTTLEDNYLKNGFWAKDKAAELANPGLFARFIVRIDDVSDAVLKGVNEKMTTSERQSLIDKDIDALQNNQKLKKFHQYIIRPFYHGNQYYAFETVTYNDVRLVGAPPEAIGKFGADTDNWEWPRHTGDFALFRIYAAPDNQPADYSENNVPFTPKYSLPISVDGVAEGDFTLVFGFPGRTQQYLPGIAVEQLVETINPARIAIRDRALKILDAAMRKDEQTKIQYASKFARIANYWKKWIGENQGLKASNALARKEKLEKEFQQKVNANPKWKAEYGILLSDFERVYQQMEKYSLAQSYNNEILNRNIEGLRIIAYLKRLVSAYDNNGEEGYNNYKNRLSNYLNKFYKDYNASIDQDVFVALTDMYAHAEGATEVSSAMQNWMKKVGANTTEQLATTQFQPSLITSKARVDQLLSLSPTAAIAQIKADPLYKMYTFLSEDYNKQVAQPMSNLEAEREKLQRQYMKALMEVFPNKRFFPDANSTMRVTYGQVNGYHPRDAVYYTPVTTLDGVMAKYKPGDYEFDVPQKLIDLHAAEDYGNYANEEGQMPVCFLGSNHTTGGNSGSPAIDGNGNLIGLNFDRVWEGTMSDINYDASICRNIMVDARYILFIIDKFAGASHLIEEMKLVHGKQNGKPVKKAKAISPERQKRIDAKRAQMKSKINKPVPHPDNKKNQKIKGSN